MKRCFFITAVFLAAMQIYGQTRNYTELNELLVKFYCYQRAGLKTGSANNCNSGFTDASHNGDNYNGTAVDGGWYDAGDYVKFGMNLSYAVYCLLKGYDVFPSGYSDKYDFNHGSTKDNIPDILNEVKFATDYMCKAVINDNTIILDVGLAEKEHGPMQRANNPGGRPAGEMVTCTGADIPLTYAACLALMSYLYREFDATYADQCLAKAKVAFNFGKKKVDAGGEGNLYCRPQLKAGQPLYDYYKDDGKYRRSITDRQVAAGVELYRATTSADPLYSTYKSYAQKNISGQFNCIGYSYIGPLAAFSAWQLGLGGDGALSSNVGFIEQNIKTSGKFSGVYQNSGWGTVREMGSVAFEYALAYVTSSKQADRDNYLKKLKTHIDWITGWSSSSRSYIVGFNNGPKNIHYRTTSSGPAGGLVSGPDGDGNWSDDGSAENCEVAIDYNAGICGATAFLRALDDPGTAIKVTTAFSATPKEVDFSKQSVSFAAAFSKECKWTLKIIGKSGVKTITKTGTSVSETWDGTADEGSFLGGETVTASITVEGKIVAYDLSKVTGMAMVITKSKTVPTSASDSIIDDFNDNDLKNKCNGTWTAFGTTGGLGGARLANGTEDNSPVLKLSGSVYTTDSARNWIGAKTTFNADGKPINMSSSKSIYFSLKGTKEVPVSVELIQPDITDSAYYRIEVPTTIQKNYYRVKLSDFTQPGWKKSEKPLNLASIAGLRFTVYDSVVSLVMNIDDVAIEGFHPSSVALNRTFSPVGFHQLITNNTLQFTLPFNTNDILELTVFNIAGKVALKRSFAMNGQNSISLPIATLPSGVYTFTSSLSGTPIGERMKMILTK
jgi:hypothetical protein